MLLSTNVHLILAGQEMAHKRKATLTCATLYSLIEKHSQQNGYCFAKNSTLAAEINKKKDTVKYYLWLMKESGWIDIKYHKEDGVIVRDGIYPTLSIDFENCTVTTKSGCVLGDQRSVEKTIRANDNEPPRDDEASVDDGDSFDAIIEETTMPVDDMKKREAAAKAVAPYVKKVEYHDETFLMMDNKAQQTYLGTVKDPEVKKHYIDLLEGKDPVEKEVEHKATATTYVDKAQESSKLPRKLTNAEYNEWVKRNDKQCNMDRRGNIIDEEFSDEIAAEIIAESDAEKATEESKIQDTPAKQIEANTQPNSISTEVATVSNNAPAQQQTTTANPYGDLATPITSTRKNYDPAEKAFYDAAKSLGISITNHNQARKWVKEVVRTRGVESAVNYFDFMRLMFPKWQYEFKPTVKTAYDLTMKAAQIEQLIQRQREEKARKIDYDNIDFYGE
nr:MAG TPA: helix-turn-helix domain protein [Caudoviricetes sp.]